MSDEPVTPIAISFRTSPTRLAYLKALNTFQLAISAAAEAEGEEAEHRAASDEGPPKKIIIAKRRVATVVGETEKGTKYNYKFQYADIADVLDAMLGELAKVGLVVEQVPVMAGNALNLVTLITHVDSGEWAESEYPLVSDYTRIKHMKIAGEITAVRRYALCPMIGVASEVPTTDELPEGAFDNIPGAEHPNAPRPAPTGERRGPPRSTPPRSTPPRSNDQRPLDDGRHDGERRERLDQRLPRDNNEPTKTARLDDEPTRTATGSGARPEATEIPGTIEGRVTDFDTFRDQYLEPLLKACTSREELQEHYDRVMVQFESSLGEASAQAITAIAKRYTKSLPRA